MRAEFCFSCVNNVYAQSHSHEIRHDIFDWWNGFFFSPFLFFNVERLFIPKAILLGQIRPCSRTCNRPCSRNFSRELSKIYMKPGCDVFHCDGCYVMTFKLLYFESHGN